jgi:integrase
VNWELLQENPFKRCKQVRLPQMKPTYLTPEDFQKLLSVIQYDWFRNIVRFAVSTMMPVGEIVNLQWSSMLKLSQHKITKKLTFKLDLQWGQVHSGKNTNLSLAHKSEADQLLNLYTIKNLLDKLPEFI